ncbi:MAG: ATP-binding protein [Pseudorhodoferax sp.]
MRITRLRVEQLRRFRAPLELDGFTPGLNILAGPNEAGKSTLVRAIRAAFFERHKSSMVDDLRPWDEGSGAAPRVEIDFELARPAAPAGQELPGPEALRAGHRHAPAGRRRGRGPPGPAVRLRLRRQGREQGRAPGHPGPAVGGTRQRAGTGGAARARAPARRAARPGPERCRGGRTGRDAAATPCCERLRKDRAELLTGTGKPTGELQAGHRRRGPAAGRHRRAGQRRSRSTASRSTGSTSCAARMPPTPGQQPWDALERDLAQARALQATLDASARQLGEDRQRLADLARTRELLGQRLAAFGQQEDDLAQRQAALAQAEAAAQAADAGRHAGPAAGRRRPGPRAGRAARRPRPPSSRPCATACSSSANRPAPTPQPRSPCAAARPGRPRRTGRAARPGRRAARPHAQAAAAAARAGAGPRAGRAAPARPSPRGWPGDCRTARPCSSDTQPLQADGELLLTAPALLRLPGGGELRITPGGQDLADLARADREAQHQLQQALAALGLADLAEAEARLAACSAAQAAVQLAEQALAIVAPQGLDALDAACAPGPGPHPGGRHRPRPPAGCAAGRRAGRPMPRRPEQAAQQALASARDALGQAQARQAAAGSRRDAARTELQAAQARLAAPERAPSRTPRSSSCCRPRPSTRRCDARVAQTAAGLQSARPDIVAQDIARLARSIDAAARQPPAAPRADPRAAERAAAGRRPGPGRAARRARRRTAARARRQQRTAAPRGRARPALRTPAGRAARPRWPGCRRRWPSACSTTCRCCCPAPACRSTSSWPRRC